MSRLALYRKYRSADFDEVVGQEHITKTLEAGISKGMAGHAYLFTGPRGTGKTTVARIVAKRLNDLGHDDDIANELDIVEIDGASNRGIDEIRSLREKVMVAPSKLKYKVYIIDEVHMLTREAFNALLKTLEEPPPHVVFVFATTEVQKLPETIISRTQRFDFRPIPNDALVSHLTHIAKSENIKLDPKAVELIATLSRGGFRDAIGLLDQLSVTNETITPELVRQFTGLQDPQKLQDLIKLSISGDAGGVLTELQALYDEGADPVIMTQQMLDMVQAALTKADPKETQGLLAVAHRLHEAQAAFKHSGLPQLVLQVALAKNQSTSINSAPTTKVAAAAPTVQKPTEAKTTQPQADVGTSSSEAKVIKALSVIKHYNNSLYAVLRGSGLEVVDDHVNVTCRFSFHRDRLKEARNQELIQKAFSKVFERDMMVSIEVENQAPSKEKGADAESELVSSAMAILGGELVEGENNGS